MDKKEILEKLKLFKEQNSSKYNIDAIGIFGSFARGEEVENSDIDICLKTKMADMFLLVHLKEELSHLFSKSVDVVRVRQKMNPFLKKRIDKDAIYV